MDTENLNKWWYSLPEEIRKKLYVQENINVWKDLDMSTRVAMFRYCRMKIFGIGKTGIWNGRCLSKRYADWRISPS